MTIPIRSVPNVRKILWQELLLAVGSSIMVQASTQRITHMIKEQTIQILVRMPESWVGQIDACSIILQDKLGQKFTRQDVIRFILAEKLKLEF